METKIKRILFFALGTTLFFMPFESFAVDNVRTFEENKCIKKVHERKWNDASIEVSNGMIVIKPNLFSSDSEGTSKYLIYANRRKVTVDKIITKLKSPTGGWFSLVGKIGDKYVIFKNLNLRYGPYEEVFDLIYSPDGKKLVWAVLDWSKIKIFEDGKIIKSYDYNDGMEIKEIVYLINTPFWVIKRALWDEIKFQLASSDWESDVVEWIGPLVVSDNKKSFSFAQTIREGDHYKTQLIKDKTEVVANVDGFIYYAQYFPDNSKVIYVAGNGEKMRVWTSQGWVSSKYDEISNLFYEGARRWVLTFSASYTIPPIVFSYRGGHFAFVARKGKNWLVVLDGKEVGEYAKAKVLAVEWSEDIFAIWAKRIQELGGWYFAYLPKDIEFFKNYGEIIGDVDYILPNIGEYYVGFISQPYKRHFAMVWINGRIFSDEGFLDLPENNEYFLLWDGKMKRCESLPQMFIKTQNDGDIIPDKFIAACDITSNKTFIVTSEYWSQELKGKFVSFKFGKEPKQLAIVNYDNGKFYLFKNWYHKILEISWKYRWEKISPISAAFSADWRLGYLYEEDESLRFWEDGDKILNLNELNSIHDSLVVDRWKYINNSKQFVAKLGKISTYWRKEGVAVNGKVNRWFDEVYLKIAPLNDAFAYIGSIKGQNRGFLWDEDKRVLIRNANEILDFSKGRFRLSEPRTWYWDINWKDIILKGYEITKDGRIAKNTIYIWRASCDPKTGKAVDFSKIQSFEDELLANELVLAREMFRSRRWLLKYAKGKKWISQVDQKIANINDITHLKKLYNHVKILRENDKYKNYKAVQDLLSYINSKIGLQIIKNI